MLEPKHDRLCYGEQLTPPGGFDFDAAIATTYSLDLNALLAAPIALCFRNTLDGDLKGEKLALLEAVGRLNGRLKVFYQKGNISFDSKYNKLFTLLEPCLHPIVPEGGAFSSFHPKLWLIRFVGDGTDNKKTDVRYRLVVLSRNLTFDRSWDIAATLDGAVGKSKIHQPAMQALYRFVAQLLSQDKNFAPATSFLQELEKIDWELPEPFRDVQFLLGGASSRPVHFEHEQYDELLVVSPFLRSTQGGISALNWLEKFTADSKRYLFSRAEELDAVGADKLAGWHCYAMNERIVNGEERHEIGDGDDKQQIKRQDLHAKIIVTQLGYDAWWQLGSANATAAALGDGKSQKPRNTEIMLLLQGAAKKIGPKQLMQEWMPVDNKSPRIFKKHEFNVVVNEPDESQTYLLRQSVHQLISATWAIEARKDASQQTYTVRIKSDLKEPLNDKVTVSVAQLAIPGSRVLGGEMIWEAVALTSISALIPVKVKVIGTDLEKQLIIEAKLSIEGGDTRQQHIMKELVDSADKVLDYIRLLLQVTPDKRRWLVFDKRGGSGEDEFVLSGSPILEQLLVAASRHPEVLRRIQQTLKRLQAAGVEIPESFAMLWEVFEKEIH